MKRTLAVLCAVTLSLAPALAQNAPAVPVTTPSQTPVDPARLAAAQDVVNHIFPEGTYARMMNGSFDAIMKSVMNSFSNIPVKQIAAIGGLSQAEVAKLGDGNLREMMAILDPAFQQRMDIIMHTMVSELPKLMATFEPGMREGLSQAYAKRYSLEQLTELNRFFATPTGSAYASNSMLIAMDPEVMSRMQAVMPQMMQQMPAIMQKAMAAAATLPKPKKPEDLTRADRAKLAKLLGVPETQISKKPAH